jgi:hypothetical protein
MKHRRGSMSSEEVKSGEECSSVEARRTVMDVRPRNWSVPVILLSLREHSSYGYELMTCSSGTATGGSWSRARRTGSPSASPS